MPLSMINRQVATCAYDTNVNRDAITAWFRMYAFSVFRGRRLFVYPSGKDGNMQHTERNKKATPKGNRFSGDWKKYGNLMIKTTFGKESITKLMICYAERVASLKY